MGRSGSPCRRPGSAGAEGPGAGTAQLSSPSAQHDKLCCPWSLPSAPWGPLLFSRLLSAAPHPWGLPAAPAGCRSALSGGFLSPRPSLHSGPRQSGTPGGASSSGRVPRGPQTRLTPPWTKPPPRPRLFPGLSDRPPPPSGLGTVSPAETQVLQSPTLCPHFPKFLHETLRE